MQWDLPRLIDFHARYGSSLKKSLGVDEFTTLDHSAGRVN